jgi:hypothetical protein
MQQVQLIRREEVAGGYARDTLLPGARASVELPTSGATQAEAEEIAEKLEALLALVQRYESIAP